MDYSKYLTYNVNATLAMTGSKIMNAHTPPCMNCSFVFAVIATSKDNLRSDAVSKVGSMMSTHVTNSASPVARNASPNANSIIRITFPFLKF